VITRYNIHVIPLYINIGQESYLDGVDMNREQFYTRLPSFPHHPTTAVPSTQRFHAAYQAAADGGATEIISIHISKALSAVVDVAHLAAQETTAAVVNVFDSSQLSLGTGFLVETAGRLAAAGKSAVEILSALTSQVKRSHVFAALDTVEFLRRSGRMNRYVAGLAGLLQIKPILTMHDGQPGSERVRTRERALGRVVEMLEALGPLERVAIVHTHALPERIAALRERAKSLLPTGHIPVEDITPVIGAHIGPGALGFAAVRADH
jgi:DegV family protein with EDD domain